MIYNIGKQLKYFLKLTEPATASELIHIIKTNII